MILAIVHSTFVVSLFLIAARLLRRHSAATRHAVLAVGLVASLIAPIATGFLPQWRLPSGSGLNIPEAWSSGRFVTEVRSPDPTPAAEKTAVNSRSAALVPPTASLLFWIWLGGVVCAGVVFFGGVSRVATLLYRSKPLVGGDCNAAAKKIVAILGIKRRVQLLENDRAVLGAWGIFKPKIFLPHDVGDWPNERVRAVLTHEMAHIKRFDWPVQMLAEVARGVCWFNPLYWLVCRLLRLESEHACDDVVLNAGFEGKSYAAHLLEIARKFRNQDRSWSPVLAMARRRHLERRFIAMLNPLLNHGSASRAAVAAMSVAVLCIALPVVAMQAPAAEQSPPARPAPLAPTILASAIPAPAATPLPAPARSKPTPKPMPLQGLADGSLRGVVYDATGAVVPGVVVMVTDQQRRIESQITTGEIGQFEFRGLPPGSYSLAAQLPGFANARIGGIEIKSSQTYRQNIILSLGRIVQRVTVSATGQPRPAVPSGVPQRIRVGGNVQAANLISQVKPTYPESVRAAGIEGTVHLQGIIGVDGSLIGLRVLGSNDRNLAVAALEAVSQWRYRPTLLNGEPAEVVTDIDVEFTLSQ
jgi:TonB family protein